MTQVIPSISVTEYPEDGFAVLEDSQGKFLAHRERDEIIDLQIKPDPVIWPTSWNQSQILLQQEFRV